MMRVFLYFMLVVLTSFYIFPIQFYFMPSVNTKMLMAVLGIMVYIVQSIFQRTTELGRGVIIIGACAFMVTFIGVISVLYNGTSDLSYATYFVSFCVWIAAAYFVVTCIRFVHQKASVDIVCKYLISVAIFQCIMAILIDRIPPLRIALNSVVVGFGSMYSAGEGLSNAGRLYGIGAALDVAGTRFCAILSIISIMAVKSHKLGKIKQQYFYFVLMLLLLVVGSMISRTTGVGMLFVVIYLCVALKGFKSLQFLLRLILVVVILCLISVLLYNYNEFFHDNLRFAFEGFFNLFETGKWRLDSTEELKEMYKLPESLKTWLIGDGYFEDPYGTDPYYVGEVHDWGMFYMGTDVGYLRFIYYFGCIGLLAFVLYFIRSTTVCISKFPSNKWVFIALLMMNLLIWLKVATDIFCLFALFLCISKEDNDAYEKQYENSLSDPLDI